MKKIAIVTGGTRGIGLGIAEMLFKSDFKVVLNYCSDEKNANAAVASFNSSDVISVKANVADELERKYLLEEVSQQFGTADVLVNNAGIIRLGRFLEIDYDSFDKIMQTNFYAPFYLAQAFANQLITEKKPGSIINILSEGVHHAANVSYGSSKAALMYATKCMAKEVGKYNIRVNSVSPGMVATKLNESNRKNDPERWEKMLKETALKRAANATEIGGAVAFLASEAASYTTGIDVLVDGGKLA